MTGFTMFGARPLRGDIDEVLRRLRAFARSHGGDAQLFDATAVFGRTHLESAYEHAVRARERGAAAAESLAVEVLRYAAGERRIDRAIARMGAKPGRPLVVMLLGDVPLAEAVRTAGLVRDDRVFSSRDKSLLVLGITAPEARTLPGARAKDLVLERVALVDLEK